MYLHSTQNGSILTPILSSARPLRQYISLTQHPLWHSGMGGSRHGWRFLLELSDTLNGRPLIMAFGYNFHTSNPIYSRYVLCDIMFTRHMFFFGTKAGTGWHGYTFSFIALPHLQTAKLNVDTLLPEEVGLFSGLEILR